MSSSTSSTPLSAPSRLEKVIRDVVHTYAAHKQPNFRRRLEIIRD
jgi:hypothetical protein